MPERQADAPFPDHSQAVVFPPVIPLTGVLVGVVLESFQSAGSRISASLRPGVRGFGGVLFCLGAAGFAWMVLTMKKDRTPIHNSATPTALLSAAADHDRDYTRAKSVPSLGDESRAFAWT
jgi:hypothetical protein